MDRRVEAWMAKAGDSWAVNWRRPVEGKGRLYKHRTFYTVQEYYDWADQHPELDLE